MALNPQAGRQALPSPQAPIVDETGRPTETHYNFLRALFARSGGALGNGLSTGNPVSPDLSVITSTLTTLTAAAATLPNLAASIASAASDAADARTLALTQADLDGVAGPAALVDLSDLYTLILTQPEAIPATPGDDPLALAILASD